MGSDSSNPNRPGSGKSNFSKSENSKIEKESSKKSTESVSVDSEVGDFGAEGKTLFGDALKKIFTAGVSAAFLTEESIKAYLSELKLPKELLTIVLNSAAKSKDEITARITKEAVSMIQKIDFTKEFVKFAEGHKFKINAEVEIIKKNNSNDVAND